MDGETRAILAVMVSLCMILMIVVAVRLLVIANLCLQEGDNISLFVDATLGCIGFVLTSMWGIVLIKTLRAQKKS